MSNFRPGDDMRLSNGLESIDPMSIALSTPEMSGRSEAQKTEKLTAPA